MIDTDGQRLGILPVRQAVAVARDRGLDLVEVSPQASPPVCKIMDYGRFKYQMKKRLHEARKKQTIIKVKEVKLGISTEEHDLQFKAQHARRFLEEGNKVKVTLVYRGREIIHPELGGKMLERFIGEIGDRALIEHPPTQEGKALTMVLGPKKGAAGGGQKAVAEGKESNAKD